jgi:peroxiredoxin family protein
MAVFLESGGAEKLRYGASIVASGAALDWEIMVILLGDALRKIVTGRLDEGWEGNEGSPARLIATARDFGRLTVVACAADVQSAGFSREEVLRHVDDVLAMPTILLRIQAAPVKLYI